LPILFVIYLPIRKPFFCFKGRVFVDFFAQRFVFIDKN
jgi:hypothetical protein